MKHSRFALGAALVASLVALTFYCCGTEDETLPPKAEPPIVPICNKLDTFPADDHTPVSNVADWGTPVRLGSPVNTLCPEDAIEIDTTTGYLYVMHTEDVLEKMSAAQMLAPANNTFRFRIIQLPDSFGGPEYFNLTLGAAGSLDGEPSFDHARGVVYFHSLRPENLGFTAQPPTDDFLDIYCATLVGGAPASLEHLSEPVNSIYPDGEHAIHPDGVSLYVASLRPGGLGRADLYRSTFDGSTWSAPANLGAPVNSIGEDKQPAFTADGDTMYFTSDRNPLIGPAVYRTAWDGNSWSAPELVISGIVGEPSLTPDGKYLYFVHVLTHANAPFDADVWYCKRN
jgi:hypothetical protein